jgi:hypothetical protein
MFGRHGSKDSRCYGLFAPCGIDVLVIPIETLRRPVLPLKLGENWRVLVGEFLGWKCGRHDERQGGGFSTGLMGGGRGGCGVEGVQDGLEGECGVGSRTAWR